MALYRYAKIFLIYLMSSDVLLHFNYIFYAVGSRGMVEIAKRRITGVHFTFGFGVLLSGIFETVVLMKQRTISEF